jgi:hypothetical protein
VAPVIPDFRFDQRAQFCAPGCSTVDSGMSPSYNCVMVEEKPHSYCCSRSFSRHDAAAYWTFLFRFRVVSHCRCRRPLRAFVVVVVVVGAGDSSVHSSCCFSPTGDTSEWSIACLCRRILRSYSFHLGDSSILGVICFVSMLPALQEATPASPWCHRRALHVVLWYGPVTLP